MTGLALSEMKSAVDLELAVAHLVFKVADLKRLRAVANSTRISVFLHFLLTKRSQLLNYVEALILSCYQLIRWLEKA